MQKKTETKTAERNSISHVYQLWGWILLLWSLYRYFFKLPEWLDEFVFKPLVFVLPVLWFVTKFEKRKLSSIGFVGKGLFNNLYIGLGFGLVFALEGIVSNVIKYGRLQINPIGVVGQYGIVLLLFLSF